MQPLIYVHDIALDQNTKISIFTGYVRVLEEIWRRVIWTENENVKRTIVNTKIWSLQSVFCIGKSTCKTMEENESKGNEAQSGEVAEKVEKKRKKRQKKMLAELQKQVCEKSYLLYVKRFLILYTNLLKSRPRFMLVMLVYLLLHFGHFAGGDKGRSPPPPPLERNIYIAW